MGRGGGCAVDGDDGGDGRVVGVGCCGRGSDEVMMVTGGSGDDVNVVDGGVEVVVADGDDDGGVERVVMTWVMVCRGGDDDCGGDVGWLPESGQRWPKTAPEKMERMREEVCVL
ncbi:hypothetical protein Tco_0240130, partial [Tanacetum coccineum]